MSRIVPKPWGREHIWAETARYVGKLLYVSAGQSLSLQYHRVKDETLLLLSGEARMVLFKEGESPVTRDLKINDVQHVPPGLRHRIEAVSDSIFAEVSTPEIEDVVRLEDRYGRTV
jgi:mannose-6-phosphate isomerase